MDGSGLWHQTGKKRRTGVPSSARIGTVVGGGLVAVTVLGRRRRGARGDATGTGTGSAPS
jgi:hypothetical protein